MDTGHFATEAVIRAFAISLGTGLLGTGIAFFVMRKRDDWHRWKAVLIMAGIGTVLIITVIIFYAWPSLVDVPPLDGLSQAQAEESLGKSRLVPDPRPQYSLAVEAGRVVPKSQSPNAGLAVQPGTVVSFAVSVQNEQTAAVDTLAATPTVSLFQPRTAEHIRCTRGADGIYRFSVKGTSSGLAPDRVWLLLWLRPVNPPSDVSGWYLQRRPANGISRVERDGSWSGLAQIGSAQWPPHDGDTFDLAVTIADNETVNQLMAQAGAVVRDEPVGMRCETAQGVVVTLK
jgi:hypothetical protein